MLKQAAIKQLTTLSNILNQMKDEDYKLSLETLKGSSIGKHVRHIIEFYECLLLNSSNEIVNYDERKRNLLLETNIKYAIDFITEINDNINKIQSNKRIVLECNYNNEKVCMESSLYRELTYNIEHTVHHLAIIGIAINMYFEYINTEDNFGYAESTINYLKSQKPAFA